MVTNLTETTRTKKEAEEEAAQLANAANEKATAKEETEVVDIEELLFK